MLSSWSLFRRSQYQKDLNISFFIDYGTLAVENALKVAMDWKVQKLILFDSLVDIQKEFQVIRNVRGKGLMCAYDLPDTDTRDRFLTYLHGERMLVLPCGSKTIRYRPALNISAEAISEGLEITRKCLKKL